MAITYTTIEPDAAVGVDVSPPQHKYANVESRYTLVFSEQRGQLNVFLSHDQLQSLLESIVVAIGETP